EVPYAGVELMLRGVRILTHRPEAPPPKRKLSLTRAAISGGLLVTKVVQPPRPPATEERQGFLHLYLPGLPPLAWRETEVHYGARGGPLPPSRHANFAQVVAELRRRCPGAAYDDRLANRTGQAQLLGPTLSAAEHLDVAISVLAGTLRRPAER